MYCYSGILLASRRGFNCQSAFRTACDLRKHCVTKSLPPPHHTLSRSFCRLSQIALVCTLNAKPPPIFPAKSHVASSAPAVSITVPSHTHTQDCYGLRGSSSVITGQRNRTGYVPRALGDFLKVPLRTPGPSVCTSTRNISSCLFLSAHEHEPRTASNARLPLLLPEACGSSCPAAKTV